MSREIRFRAWDRKERLMWPWDEMNADTKHMQVGGIQDFFEDLNLIFMQYTDQLDKNGKPIYESDIVHWTISHDDPEVAAINQGNFEVIWRCGGWALDLPAGVPVPRSSSLWKVIDDVEEDRGSLEVVGDVYTTPELLKGEL